MSGPTTAVLVADTRALLMAAAGIRAAAALHAGYAQAADLRRRHQADRAAQHGQQSAAARQGYQALMQQIVAEERRFALMATNARHLGIDAQLQAARPVRPESGGDGESAVAALAAYLDGLRVLMDEVEVIFRTEGARLLHELPSALDEVGLPADMLAAFETGPSRAQRLLQRIAPLGPVPRPLIDLALEMDASGGGSRADLLDSQLRLQIQKHIEAIQQRQVQEASAIVVEQSLKDLGYQVEEIGSTLFVEGGVVHFRRQGWTDYMVRMRVNARAGEVNFNVIRALSADSATAQGQNEITVLDHLAEDRWCAEFPALLQTLAAKGLHLNVTRRLAAGEVPVQLVEAGKLPRFADEEQAAMAAERERGLPG